MPRQNTPCFDVSSEQATASELVKCVPYFEQVRRLEKEVESQNEELMHYAQSRKHKEAFRQGKHRFFVHQFDGNIRCIKKLILRAWRGYTFKFKMDFQHLLARCLLKSKSTIFTAWRNLTQRHSQASIERLVSAETDSTDDIPGSIEVQNDEMDSEDRHKRHINLEVVKALSVLQSHTTTRLSDNGHEVRVFPSWFVIKITTPS